MAARTVRSGEIVGNTAAGTNCKLQQGFAVDSDNTLDNT